MRLCSNRRWSRDRTPSWVTPARALPRRGAPQAAAPSSRLRFRDQALGFAEPGAHEPLDRALFPITNHGQLRAGAQFQSGAGVLERIMPLRHAGHPAGSVGRALEKGNAQLAAHQFSLTVDELAHAVELAAQGANGELGLSRRLEREHAV